MPEEIESEIPQKIEVQVPVMRTGKVEFMNKKGFKYPAPETMKRALAALRYFAAGIVTMVGGSDLFTGGQSKIICFCMGALVLLTGAIEIGTGVSPASAPVAPPLEPIEQDQPIV